MQLTSFTDYGLRALIYMASLPEGRMTSISEVTDVYGVSRNHMVKIINQLSRAGYVTAVRGKNGGIRLGKPAKRVFIGEQWQILLLDSQVFGVPHGELSEFQLEWLERKLADAPERHTLLLLHHHPLPAGCSWLDQHSLRNAGELDTVLAKFPHVKYLLCGHIHQELDLDWNGRRLLATPSTCVQFKPHCSNFTLDTIAPGWRTLELHADGTLTTEVHRLADARFQPDTASEGY